jgi:MraZ protein
MLLGEYEHTLDDKNRLTLPAKFRASMAGGVVLVRGLDRCIEAHPLDGWHRILESRLAGLDPFTPEGRKLARFYFSGGTETEPDRQGRVMLPAALIKYAGLRRDVVVVGMNDRLEIWDRDAWRAQLEEVIGDAEDAAERLAAHHD